MLNLKYNINKKNKNNIFSDLLMYKKKNVNVLVKRISTTSVNNSYKNDHLYNFFYYNIIPNIVILTIIKLFLTSECKKTIFKVLISENIIEELDNKIEKIDSYIDNNVSKHVDMIENKVNGIKSDGTTIRIDVNANGGVEDTKSSIFNYNNLKTLIGFSLLLYICMNQCEIIHMLSALKNTTCDFVNSSTNNILENNAKNAANVIKSVNNHQSVDNNKTFEQVHTILKRIVQMISNINPNPKDTNSKGGSGNSLPSMGENDWERK